RLADFMRVLNGWTPERGEEPGKQHTYTHTGYVLLQVALERRFGMPIAELMHRRLLAPLGMTSTFIPERGELAAEFPDRVVQGYAEDGQPVGAPGDQQSYFDFPGTGQMFSSPRDLAIFLAAELDELPLAPPLGDAMDSAGCLPPQPAQHAGDGVGGQRIRRAADRRQARRSRQRLGLHRPGAEPKARARDPVQPRQSVSARACAREAAAGARTSDQPVAELHEANPASRAPEPCPPGSADRAARRRNRLRR